MTTAETAARTIRAPRGSERTCRTWQAEAALRGGARCQAVRGGRPNAETSFKVLATYRGGALSLLSLRPQTGKTHQLRVQTASRGHPIAGDERYGDFRWNRELKSDIGLKRMYLHALRMSFRHPESGRQLMRKA